MNSQNKLSAVEPWQDSEWFALWLRMARGLAVVLILGLVVGCANTVVPKPASDNVASWDGTNQNSGFICYLPNGSGLITPRARERYNGLVAIYGRKFVPPVREGDGLKPHGENWEIDPEHLVKFGVMNRWRKSGL